MISMKAVSNFLLIGFLLSSLAVRFSAGRENEILADEAYEEQVCKDNNDVKIYILGNLTQSRILVVDNFLGDLSRTIFRNISQSDHWVPLIPAHRKAFVYDNITDLWEPPTKAQTGYPGLRLSLSDEYGHAVLERLIELNLIEVFPDDLPARESKDEPQQLVFDWNDDSFFGNTCYHPDQLSPKQRAPHVDSGFVNSGYTAIPISLAMVHYLSAAAFSGSGGTGFYRQISSRASRFRPSDCSKLRRLAAEGHAAHSAGYKAVAGYCYCERNAYCPMSEVPKGYFSVGNDEFELLHHVPYKFDRVVIYSTKQLHTAYIDDVSKLSCNATKGRISANLFLAVSKS